MAKINGFEFISPDKWRFLNNAEVEKAALRAAEYDKRNFHFDNLEYHVEEYLRQWGLTQLIEVYGYPENWLWLANASKRNANIVIKDENNRSLALVAARYFGESDLEFEQAGHALQSDLENIETVRFGIVTDGRRIAFLCKNADEQIGDYKTITDFPVYLQLKNYVETNQLPDLSTTTHKFQKLPAPKHFVKTNAGTSLSELAVKNYDDASVALANNSRSVNRRTIAAVLGAALLVLLGAWYITRSEPRADAQSSPFKDDTVQAAENKDQPNSKTSIQNAVTVKPLAAPNNSAPSRRQNPNSLTQSAPRETDATGALKLNRQELNVMQNQPVGAAPSSRKAPPKTTVSSAQTAETLPPNRKIIRQPFTQ